MELYEEIEKTFSILEKVFSKEDLLKFKNTQIDDLCLYHFGFGTLIRNDLLYPKNSILYGLFLENGMEHPDDMSSIIIKLFHRHVRRKYK